ncbi:MAG: acetylornithine/succinylornithine family transaminase [Lentisphaeria bacterium]|nr:acetylornithine/succinylornithine family transaminase [Lentisphaeria bacterium]
MSESFKELDGAFVAGTYNRFPVEVVSGKGAVWTAADGREYIDMGSGIGVNSFGCLDDEWRQAVVAQLGKIQHASNLYYTEPCAKLARLLCERTGMKKVFFCNSGAEANECAIKVARKYAADKKGEGHSTVITMQNSFHGRTLTTLAATGQEHYHELFQPLTPGFVSTPVNDIAALEACVKANSPAAIMLECIQGEGGVNVLDAAFVQAAARIAKEQDIVLIVDEVQTGNGRTGKLYSYMHFGIQPDVVSTAKGLGGGLPLGATLMSEKVQGVLGFGDHGSTFGGNPVCCAGAISILSRLTDDFLAEVSRKSRHVFDELSKAPGVQAMSGIGLMIGIKPEKPAGDVVKACMEKGVLCLTAKDKVRLLPPLNIPMETLDKALAVIKAALA